MDKLKTTDEAKTLITDLLTMFNKIENKLSSLESEVNFIKEDVREIKIKLSKSK